MGSFAKWLGGGLGFVMGGPIGAIIGFVVGAVVDNTSIYTHGHRHLTRPGRATSE